ncbi:MAG: T9SS type A sorting domain-containing protein [Bacteroidota bacterium]
MKQLSWFCLFLFTASLAHAQFHLSSSFSIDSWNVSLDAQERVNIGFPPQARQSSVQLDSFYHSTYDTIAQQMIPSFRHVYEYPNTDESRFTTSLYNRFFHSWGVHRQFLKVYDPTTYTEVNTWRLWHPWTASFRDSSQQEIQKDSLDRYIRFTNRDWEAGQWQGLTQDLIQYHTHPFDFTYYAQSWDQTSNGWKSFRRDSIFHFADGNRSLSKGWNWDTPTQIWTPASRIIYTQDSLGLWTLRRVERYDELLASWFNSSLSHTYFDSAGNRIEYIFQSWDGTTGEWINQNRNLHTYDSLGHQIYSNSQSWDMQTQNWTDNSQIFRTFNLSGLLVLSESYFRDSTSWVKDSRFELTYTDEGELARELWLRKHPVRDEWVPLNQQDYFYSLPNHLEHSFSNMACDIPNPVHATQSLSCSSLLPHHAYQWRIFDLSGRQIQQRELLGREAFQLAPNISEGIVILSISSDQGLLYREKIVVK